ncbi:hypothetical protein ACLF3G_29050 [Falsiroseomonas sp. HC035]|uniref:hypothetical protein n=1 Tax=Falsiroseomonas sp. HC035 TaxID=3390999 RepID=UPI003D316F29
MAKVVRLRPKRHDVIAEALQLALDMPLDLTDPTRDELAERLARYQPAEAWRYTMLNPQQLRALLRLINACPKPATTLSIWTAAVSYVRYDTGEIMANRTTLAEDAGTSATEASSALARLTEMGALVRLRPGRYAINSNVGWTGSLAKREAAARETPQLRLVEP